MPKLKSKVNDEIVGQFTSMIDMVFLLVIFFILQPMKEEEMRMRAELPKQDDQPPLPPDVPPVTLQVVSFGDRGGWRVDGEAVTGSVMDLARRIQRASGGNPDTNITIQPEPNVKFDYVLQALDACGIANMTKVGFATPILRTD